jgi:hypothetical protein
VLKKKASKSACLLDLNLAPRELGLSEEANKSEIKLMSSHLGNAGNK